VAAVSADLTSVHGDRYSACMSWKRELCPFSCPLVLASNKVIY
jgi:hypothetical protein